MNNPPETKISTPESLIENVRHLGSSPEVYFRLKQVLNDPGDTRQQAAEVIAYAPSLNASILDIANSSYYGFANRIDSVPAAINITGEKEPGNIVPATAEVSSMRGLVVYWPRPGD